MSEKEAIEDALRTERRMVQRQELFKRLWRLMRGESSKETVVVENEKAKNAPPANDAKHRDATECVLASAPADS